jgi:Uma2 family endonuclease
MALMQKLENHRWTTGAYDRMVAHGVFSPGERVELIDGEVMNMTPQGSVHATGVLLALQQLQRAFGAGFHVRPQAPLVADPLSEPEPDVSVVRGGVRDYAACHPSAHDAVLVVEVSDSSLEYDRGTKGSLCARAGIPEYWIVNLIDLQLEVYRRPQPDPAARLGWGYADRFSVSSGQSASPLEMPSAAVAVRDLLPSP